MSKLCWRKLVQMWNEYGSVLSLNKDQCLGAGCHWGIVLVLTKRINFAFSPSYTKALIQKLTRINSALISTCGIPVEMWRGQKFCQGGNCFRVKIVEKAEIGWLLSSPGSRGYIGAWHGIICVWKCCFCCVLRRTWKKYSSEWKVIIRSTVINCSSFSLRERPKEISSLSSENYQVTY